MGAWGVLPFDDDDANDWAYGLESVGDLSLVESAFSTVEKTTRAYLEAPEAAKALAACEVLARLKGNFGYQNAYTVKVDEWVKQHPTKPTAEILTRAQRVIDRILAKSSKLRDLWEEADAAEWLQSVDDLRRRLHA